MKLAHLVAQGRDNNFNLIRIFAALAVMVTHSFAIVTGTGQAEPLRNAYGMTLGTIAVDVFFITSGFLITASLLNRKNIIEFVWARVLRIYPALWVMLLLTVLVLGPCMTSIPAHAYFTSPKVYHYLEKCATLVTGIVWGLPGVFVHNPYSGAVNSSLWSMPYEIRMYAILALTWVGFKFMPTIRHRLFDLTVVSSALLAGLYILAKYFFGHRPPHFELHDDLIFPGLFFMFFTGAALYVLKEKIIVSHRIAAVLALGLLAALINRDAFFAVYILTLAYLVLYLAYVPGGLIRNYNKLGDYSYGMYIYAFPVQQTVVALIPGQSIVVTTLISMLITLFLAVLSWHYLERRALGLKTAFVLHTHKLLKSTNRPSADHQPADTTD